MWLFNLLVCFWHLVIPSCFKSADLNTQSLNGASLESSKPAVHFEINVTTQFVNPIGSGLREAILINNKFIGPTLRLTQGDEVELLVHNYLGEDTTVHFHGIGQRTTPWSDGVPGLTQGQIRPGAAFLYRWRAEDAGVYFYHAHSRGQLMDGMYGAIVIEAPEETERPFHLISSDAKDQKAMRIAEQAQEPLLLADWSQYKFDQFWHIEEAANVDLACTDSIIINGVGSQYCLDQDSLDSMTHPGLMEILKKIGQNHLTDKGCMPPLPLFQGDFDFHFDRLPERAYYACNATENPKGNFTFSVDSSVGWAALTLVNPGGLYPLQVSIDNHELYVYAIDGHYVEPVATDRILVSNGNRISVMVKLDKEPARYFVRVGNELLNQVLGGYAEMAYDGAENQPSLALPRQNHAGQALNNEVRSFKAEQSHPFPPIRPARNPDRTHTLTLRKAGRPYHSYEWSLSGHNVYNMTEEETDPALLFKLPEDLPGSELLVRSELGEWVDLILITEGPFAQSHPMHKHGNRVFFLGAGVGEFTWRTVEEAEQHLPKGTFNFENPPYQDTFTTPDIVGEASAVWTVVRYKAEYAGAWLMHCHVQTHLSGGMGVVILDGVDKWPEVPLEYREWNGFDRPNVEASISRSSN